MNFAAMKTEVSRRLYESSSAPVYWTEADIETAINEGYEEISDATEWYERHATMQFMSGRTYMSLNSVLPPDEFLSPRRAFNNQTQRWLVPSDVRDLDHNTFRMWETVTGEPQQMIMRGLWWFGLFPKPASDSGTVKLYFTSIPPLLFEDEDEPAFPEEFHQGLVEYALYDLKAQEREPKIALMYWDGFQRYQAWLSNYVKGRVKLDRAGVLGA